jgi:hypothetical protein
MTIHTPRQPDLFGTDDLLIGLRVRLDRAIDRNQPCHGNICEVAAGRAPHSHALLCVSCGRFRGWLPVKASTFIAETIRVHGVPNAPLTWRDTTHDQ